MSTISQQLDRILTTRAARLKDIDTAIATWRSRETALEEILTKTEAAERANPDLRGASAQLRSTAESIHGILADYALIRVRFARETLCVGIGGAAGMGKSTFLQSATGLSEEQIPTGDLFCTTAVRSLIENSTTENTAVADFHSPESFVAEVIAPLCNELGISAPSSLGAFRTMQLALPAGIEDNQKHRDILKRLQDAQSHLSEYEVYLTGRRGVSIQLDKLRPFVAYPSDGNTKAGPFLAIANLVVKVPFPATDFARLRVVDLPGIGEAGINLAKAQTESLKNSCDITLLVKKAAQGRIEWEDKDTTALDAMRGVVPHVEDQTKFTMVLINGDAADPIRTKSCEENFRAKVDRPFETVVCDARKPEIVTRETMPRILDFLAKNLPAIDEAILARQDAKASASHEAARRDLVAVASRVRDIAPAGTGEIDFANDLKVRVNKVLVSHEKCANDRAVGNDKEWDDEVARIHDVVATWVKNGCGYGSRDALLDALRNEIMENKTQPATVINECRVKFRNQWEAMDLHIEDRIAKLLGGVMDALKNEMHDFVPARMAAAKPVEAVRAQIIAFADRIDARTSDIGDDEALRELSQPLRRIAEFDLQFRFHLEPMLHAATHLLFAYELPLVKNENDAGPFLDALEKKLLEAADAYASGMRKSGTGNSAALERKKRLFEKAIPDASVRSDVIALLEQSMGSAQSFCPNRIFAAVVETFADAFIRSKNSKKAFQILAHEWRDELTPAPDEKTRLTNAAAGALNALAKTF